VRSGEVSGGGLRLLWLTPMRALAADTARALATPLADLGLSWSVGVRTGDTDAGERARQAQRLPEVLITTPESLSLLLTRADSREQLSDIALVVVDEWHELIGTKRGVQVQLALARLRRFARGRTDAAALAHRPGAGNGGGGLEMPPVVAPTPAPPVWGLSATLGNTEHAMQVLLGSDNGVLVRGRVEKKIVVDTLLPEEPGRFPWGGHLGIRMLEPVVREIARASTTLIFTNTRSQAEIWYRSILQAKPKWAGLIALHHGSLDRDVRDWVELGLKEGRLKAVVATSSLDLGVDFLPVERVLQIGSPKGVARLLQRAAGRYAPGLVARDAVRPTPSTRQAAAARTPHRRAHQIEARPSGRSACWFSIWCRSQLAPASSIPICWPRSAPPGVFASSPTPNGTGRSTSSGVADLRCRRIRNITALSAARTASGTSRTRASGSGSACRSEPSSPRRRCW
jgi:ATP-dependent Lhr-like helicase